MADIEAWERAAEKMKENSGASKLELIKLFCDIEVRLELVERMVDALDRAIDRANLAEIDRQRGK